MTAPILHPIDVSKARELVADGAILVDIREADEHARERIPGARHAALTSLPESARASDDDLLIFHCRSGARTQANASALAGAAGCEAYLLEGGLDAWKKAGLPVEVDRSQPMEMNRQVQITAGSLVFLGAALGYLVHPGFYALSAFIGAGLVFAGVSGTCGMARMLALMPWNQQRSAGVSQVT